MGNNKNSKTIILIVEDDQVTMELTTKMLAGQGYQTIAATDGERCLDMVQKAKPDLILMDVGLPVKNGIAKLRIEFTRQAFRPKL